jgi:hypothetical protein
MEISDILYNTYDIKTVISLCKVNKTNKRICDNKEFWKLFFAKHDLPFIDNNYNNVNDWLKLYFKTIKNE